MVEKNKNKLVEQTAQTLATDTEEVVQGFEEAHSDDVIVPRVKVINALSPERIDGDATEGDVIDSLSGESVKGKRFIPVKVYYSNIHWNPDRSDEENRIFCRSFDGVTGTDYTGECTACHKCGMTQFDNTKTGKEAQPQCTAYLNFLGFFAGEYMPVVLSFARTNYNEGKKMLSIAKSLRKSIWSYQYTIDSKQITKGKNKWYNIVVQLSEPTSEEDKAVAAEIFKQYQAQVVKADYQNDNISGGTTTDAETEAEI